MSTTPRPVKIAAAFGAWMLLAVAAMGTLASGPGLKLPVLVQASVLGLGDALLAVGLVLVYRATRVINFAAGGFGVVGAALFYELVHHLHVTYWLALPAGVLVSALLGGVVEVLVVRRFAHRPRLILAVATIGVAQLLSGLAGAMPALLGDDRFQGGTLETPLSSWRVTLSPLVFDGNHFLLGGAAVVVLVGLSLFLSRSRMGVAVRGAAANEDRAQLLGVNTGNLSTLVWLLAAALAGVTTVLRVGVLGYAGPSSGVAIGGSGLLLILAAAVIGGMDDLPVTALAAVALNVLSQVVFFVTHKTNMIDPALLVVIATAFLVRRRSLQRTDESSTSSWAATEEVRPVPRELARLPVVRDAGRRVLGAVALVVLVFPFVGSPSQTSLASYYALNGIVMISLVMLTGWAGQISLGQFGFVAVGAIVTGSLSTKVGVPFFLALLVGSFAGAAVAMLLGLTALRVRGLYLAVTTLAFAVTMASVALDPGTSRAILPGAVERPALLFLDTNNEIVFYYLCLAVLGGVWWVALGLRRSRTGRVLIALRENERNAEAFGVAVVRARLTTFALSGFVAAFAGGLLAAQQHTVGAGYLGAEKSVQIFLTAVIGGLGSIQGALFGSAYLAVVGLLVPGQVGTLLANSLGVLVVLLFFPGGIGSVVYAARDAVLRRIAIRRRMAVPSLFGNREVHAGARAAMAPLPAAEGTGRRRVPVRYRQPSRLRVAGRSQLDGSKV